ncbi:hypothetical protein BWQ96_02927 [Gracilariopsis chorda]|uniref:Methyltransferase small domain-containing protein n=1 Tax=Gracilariopsis chorda TaxID=448386 RepID=A0A2V3IYU6_9FLOR|nr:hypothetical protein BWQ96_02927 [Gracilariopsis chorda]|eukprot:PXF47314.1 hypothetical protein BWQ96_02927 [Gracilariopsis chorda]
MQRHAFVPPALRTPSLSGLIPRRSRRHPKCSAEHDPVLVLSHFEARHFFSLKSQATTQLTAHPGPFSINLGHDSLPAISLDHEGVSLPPHPHPLLSWAHLKKLSKNNSTGAYEVFPDLSAPEKIAELSLLTNRPASLLPVGPNVPPTLVLAGFSMHRFKSFDPAADTAEKLAALSPLRGRVLDICTGLGYTAIAAARSPAVTSLTTIELDPMVISIARRNPWSAELFSLRKIKIVEDDATQALPRLQDKSFDVIIHDPPARVLAGDLYSLLFYRQLRRVCASRALLFHYIGDPNSRESGRLYKGITDRLLQAGFGRIQLQPRAYGLTAHAM